MEIFEYSNYKTPNLIDPNVMQEIINHNKNSSISNEKHIIDNIKSYILDGLSDYIYNNIKLILYLLITIILLTIRYYQYKKIKNNMTL